MLIALVSGKGSPGTSTTALALTLAWPRPALLVECDPRGGDLLWGYGQGRHADGRGLLNLQIAARRETMTSALWSTTVELGENRWALPGLEEPKQAGSVEWASLGRALTAQTGVDVIADCGVVPALRAPSPVWTAADMVVLVMGSSLRGTRAAVNAAGLLRSELMSTGLGADRLVSSVVGPGRPYPLGDVRTAMAEAALVVGDMPWDPAAAATLSEGAPARRRLKRFLAAATDLGNAIGAKAMSMHAQTGEFHAEPRVLGSALRHSSEMSAPRPVPSSSSAGSRPPPWAPPARVGECRGEQS